MNISVQKSELMFEKVKKRRWNRVNGTFEHHFVNSFYIGVNIKGIKIICHILKICRNKNDTKHNNFVNTWI